MSDCEKSQQQLIEELELLHREVAELQTQKTAFDTLHELLILLVKTGKTASGALMLKAVLQQIVKISIRLTNAEESSIFLLDNNGTVTESILARGAVIRDLKQKLIGSVLDKGLAGWVTRHRQIGLITDTMYDDRWLTLPNQPYTVRSALGVPLIRGNKLLGILTITHSQPKHFSLKEAHVMQMVAEQMSLIVENALLYVECQPSPIKSSQKLKSIDSKLDKKIVQEQQNLEQKPLTTENLALLGIYIIVAEGKFLYTNPGVAGIFGYTFMEFITVESIFELVTTSNYELVNQQINQCLQSQNKILSCTFQGLRKDGTFIKVQAYGTKTKLNGKPVIIGILSSLRNI